MSHLSEDKIASEAIWEAHKKAIQQLYLSERTTLTRLMDVMRDSHNFDATYEINENSFKFLH